MKTIKTEIIINASKEKVWKILMSHKDYPNWNPFIKKVEGEAKVGNQIQITVQSDGKKPMNFSPIVLKNDAIREFRWQGKLLVKGLFDGEHYFILERQADGKTKFIHGENFTGLLSGVLLNMIKEDTEKGFEQMNVKLKALAELEN